MINFPLLLLISLVTLIIIYYIYREIQVDIFRPTVTAGAIFIMFYILDIFYIMYHSQISDSFELSGSSFLYSHINEISFVSIFCILMWFLGDFFASKIDADLSMENKLDLKINSSSNFRFIIPSAFLVIGILLLNLIGFLNFINSIGGFIWYYQNIANRALIFSESTYFYALIQLTSVIGSIMAGYFISIMRVRKTNIFFKLLTALIILLVISLSLLTGARATILKSIVIMLVMVNYLGGKIKFNLKFVASFLILGIFFVVFAEQSRNVEENANETVIDSIYDGTEISQINNSIVLENYNLVNLPESYTILQGLLSFIPGSLFEAYGGEKPAGGNAVFTESVWPDRWYRTESEVALGLLGESLLNVGYFLAPFIFLAIGFFYRQIYEFLISKNKLGGVGLLLYIGVLWSIFQLLRGDIYNTVNNLFVYSVACFFSVWLINLTILKKEEVPTKQNLEVARS